MLQIWTVSFTLYNVVTLIAFGKSERCGPHERGTCKLIWHCPEALEMVNEGRRPFLCGYHRGDPVVCCFSRRHQYEQYHHQQVTSFISRKKCQEYEEKICAIETRTFHVAVVGGHTTKPKELPFMGLVGYGNKHNIDWACGCSLISEKFALSAAHCTKHPSGGFAQWIRLGELDLASNHEEANPEDHRIIRRINHPKYNSQFVYNDIALYELENEITHFTSFIQPICLPRRESFENVETVVGAGWGATDVVASTTGGLTLKNYQKCYIYS